MIVVLAGLRFEVVPDDRISSAERRALAALPDGAATLDAGSFVLELSPDPPTPRGDEGDEDLRAPDETAAAVRWTGDRVRIGHRRLRATLDPFARRGVLERDPEVAWPLEVSLRVALASRLPLEGGLALHAAGVVLGDGGFVFFGPSGAGKSTLAAAAPGPVLSDEMVAVTRRTSGYALESTGFWGTLGASAAPPGPVPLRALLELARAPTLELTPLDPRTALRRLIPCALVPPGPPLWSAALAVMGRLTGDVPVLRMAWSPAEPPWPALERLAGALVVGRVGVVRPAL
jgi:hypothetical protein